MKITYALIALLTLGSTLLCDLPGQEKELIDALTKVGAKGTGNEKAVRAWPAVRKLDASSVPNLLKAMNEANDLGDNWIRSAISEILDRDNSGFPEKQILAYLKDDRNTGSSRRLAFDIILEHKPKLSHSLTPKFIDDREPTLRRLAVEKLLESARKAEKPGKSKALFEKVLSKGREVDQIKEAKEALEKAGQKIDVQTLMGFLVNWHTIGPFDNTGRQGFGVEYPPEKKIDLKASYEGKNEKAKWSAFTTPDPFGMLNVNLQYGEIKEVLAYAHTTFDSDSERPAQFRIGSKNAWKLWLNGELLFARDEYHRGGTRVDQFIIDGKLSKGTNEILVKVCQNEQTQPWTKQWEFCLRVTDPSGTALTSVKTGN
ncbi:MAG: hypothetical protein HN531_02410 [Opitutae bacterium]|nr:hypothetical protein [Opitutae bacterium]